MRQHTAATSVAAVFFIPTSTHIQDRLPPSQWQLPRKHKPFVFLQSNNLDIDPHILASMLEIRGEVADWPLRRLIHLTTLFPV